jgi:peptidoglycan/xylan/chitin deacetylase (PgdA/CDA1 family)
MSATPVIPRSLGLAGRRGNRRDCGFLGTRPPVVPRNDKFIGRSPGLAPSVIPRSFGLAGRRGIRSLAGTLALASAVPAGAAEPFVWPNGAKSAVVLTYDDAMDTHLDNAAPDLEAAGLRGTFFVPGHSESLAKRLPEWRALAARGHELGNHAIFHPCLRKPATGVEREWVRPEYALEGYTVERIRDEVAAMNTTLLAIDGETTRTLAYNCCDTTAGGRSYVDAVRPLFLAARAGEDRTAADVGALDPMLVPSWAATNVTGAQLVAFAKKARDEGGLAVFQFHGIGGEWIPVSREAHRELLAWLAANRQSVWTDTFRRVMAHVEAEQARRRAEH